MSESILTISLALLAGSFLLLSNKDKNREGFQMDESLMFARGGNDYGNLTSNAANFPSIPSLRYDANGLINAPLRGSTPGNLGAAGPSFTNESGKPVSFATIGSYNVGNLLNDRKFLTSGQVSDTLANTFGTNTPQLQEARDLLPIPDMKYSATVDPTNPENFIYDRTIFAPLKRRYGNQVDFIRGDIDVAPIYRGYFDIRPPSDVDVVKGYFDSYIDIQQNTAIRDSVFERATPIEQLQENAVNPFGNVSKLSYP